MSCAIIPVSKRKLVQDYKPAPEDEMEELVKFLSALNVDINNMNSSDDIKNFNRKYCISRTYFFQIFKCEMPNLNFMVYGVAIVIQQSFLALYPMDGIIIVLIMTPEKNSYQTGRPGETFA